MPRVLKWTAVGMRSEGMGEYVEKRDYDELLADFQEYMRVLGPSAEYAVQHAMVSKMSAKYP